MAAPATRRAGSLTPWTRLGWLRWPLFVALGIHLLGLAASVPYARDAADFAVYYAAGRSVLDGVSPYDPAAQRVAATSDAQLAAALGASGGIPYTPPAFLAWFFAPLAAVPFRLVRPLWWLLQLAVIALLARMLADEYALDPRLAALAAVSFAPLTLAAAVGNIASLLPLAMLVLLRAIRGDPGVPGTFSVAVMAGTKVFPNAFLLVPLLRGRMSWVIRVVAVQLALLLLPEAVAPGSLAAFVGALREHQGSGCATMLGHHNVSAVIRHLRGIAFAYDRGRASATRAWPALLSLSEGAFEVVQYALWGAGALAATGAALMLTRRGMPRTALWGMCLILLVSQPYTLYIYYAAVLPLIVCLQLHREPRARAASVAAYALLGIGRFAGLTSAALPYPLGLFAYHAPTLGTLALGIGLLVAAARCHGDLGSVSAIGFPGTMP